MHATLSAEQIKHLRRMRNLSKAPAIGMVAMVLATILAISFIPGDPFPRKAMFWPGVWLTLGLFAVPIYTAVIDYRSIFRTENIVMFGVFFLVVLDLVQGAFGLYGATVEGIQTAIVCVGVFVTAFWMANFVPAWQLPKFIRTGLAIEFSADRLFSIAVVFFMLAIFNYVYACRFDIVLLVESLLSNRWAAPWVRGALGDWSSFREHLVYFGYLLPLLAVAIGMKKGWAHPTTFATVVMAVIFECFLIHSGSRRVVGATLGSGLLFWLLSQPRLSAKTVGIGAVWLLSILVIMQLMIENRNTGLRAMLFGDKDAAVNTEVIRVDDNFLRLAQVTDFVPEIVPFAYWERFIYTLVRPIPRVLWPDKPTNAAGFDLANALGRKGVTLSASVLADWYHVAGLIGVFIGGALYGRLSSMWSRLLAYSGHGSATLVYCLGVMAVVVSLRSIDELVLFSYPFIAWYAYTKLFYRPPEPSPAGMPA